MEVDRYLSDKTGEFELYTRPKWAAGNAHHQMAASMLRPVWSPDSKSCSIGTNLQPGTSALMTRSLWW